MTWRRRTCREDGSCGHTVVVHRELVEQSQAVNRQQWPMQTVNVYSQTMRSNYLRGIVLSGFSLAVVNATSR